MLDSECQYSYTGFRRGSEPIRDAIEALTGIPAFFKDLLMHTYTQSGRITSLLGQIWFPSFF